jgi:hypothetical protein
MEDTVINKNKDRTKRPGAKSPTKPDMNPKITKEMRIKTTQR